MELSDKSVAEFAGELAQIPFFSDLSPGTLLRRVPFFADVDAELLEKIASQCILRILRPQSIVCSQGEYGDTFFLILKGRVEVSVRTQETLHLRLAELGEGEFFGEYAPLTETARTATVTAIDRTILLEVEKEAFLKLRDESPSVKSRIDEVYMDRVLATQLRQVGVFSELSEEAVRALKREVELEEYNRGETIIRRGEVGDSLYIIRSGFVKVSVGEGEEEKILAYLKAGSYFGEMSLLRGEKRTANVAAVTKVEVVKINSAHFAGLLERYPEIKARLESMMEKRDEEAREIEDDTELARKMKFAVDTGLVQAGQVLIIDLDVCVRCNSCVEACAATHEGFPRLERTGHRLGRLLLPINCMHCANPECMLCPHGGIYRDKNGEIHHTVNCIHCGGCARRCPYGNILVIQLSEARKKSILKRKKSEVDGKTGARHKQRVVKCDLCYDKPFVACVYNCPVGACRLIMPEEFLSLSTE